MVQESTERVGAAGAVVADALLRPAAVIDGVVGLHRSNHVQLCESVKVFCRHVLRMFDAKAAIALTVRLHDLRYTDRE